MIKDSYSNPFYSGLLEPKHIHQIGSALWVFMWCICRTTREVKEDNIIWGKVLNGSPIKIRNFSKSLGIPFRSIERHLWRLEKYNYIELIRRQYGFEIWVRKSKKFGRKHRLATFGKSDDKNGKS